MTDNGEFLTEAEARRLWQRAAELQAEEALGAEKQAVSGAEDELPGEGRRQPDGYALTHVREAATEAGIGEPFLETALAELRTERAAGLVAPPKRRLSRWLLGHPPDAITARRVVRAAPAAVLSAMEEIFPNEPFTLTLRERLGDPEAGGTLVFDIQGVGFTTQGVPGFKGDASVADLRQVYVTVMPRPGDSAATEVTIRSPIAWALRINGAASGGVSLLGGAIALLLTGAVGSSVGFLGPVGFALLVAAGGSAGGAATLTGFRAMYRYGLKRGARALDGLLATVAAKAEGGWGLAHRPEGSVTEGRG